MKCVPLCSVKFTEEKKMINLMNISYTNPFGFFIQTVI